MSCLGQRCPDNRGPTVCLSVCSMYICMYVYTHVCVCTHVCVLREGNVIPQCVFYVCGYLLYRGCHFSRISLLFGVTCHFSSTFSLDDGLSGISVTHPNTVVGGSLGMYMDPLAV